MNKKIIKLLILVVLVWLLLPYNILILGSDARGSNLKGSRTDGIILIKLLMLLHMEDKKKVLEQLKNF